MGIMNFQLDNHLIVLEDIPLSFLLERLFAFYRDLGSIKEATKCLDSALNVRINTLGCEDIAVSFGDYQYQMTIKMPMIHCYPFRISVMVDLVT